MDALVNYCVRNLNWHQLLQQTQWVLTLYLSTGENRPVLHWSITSTASLWTARGRSTHRICATAFQLMKAKMMKTITTVMYTSGNNYHIRQTTFQQYKDSSASHLGLAGFLWSAAKILCYHRLQLQPLHHHQLLTVQQHEHTVIFTRKISGYQDTTNISCVCQYRNSHKLW